MITGYQSGPAGDYFTLIWSRQSSCLVPNMHRDPFKSLVDLFQEVIRQLEEAQGPAEKRAWLAYSRQITLDAKELARIRHELRLAGKL